MRDGCIVQAGPFKELAQTPAEPFVEQFITAQREPIMSKHLSIKRC